MAIPSAVRVLNIYDGLVGSTGRTRVGRIPLIGTTAGKSTVAVGRLLGALLCTLLCAGPVHADDADFAKQKKCMNCHAIDQKLVGPAYKAVAARYASDKEAEARLARKIREGGAGAWGVVPMPSNDVTSTEAQRLARWVLMQK